MPDDIKDVMDVFTDADAERSAKVLNIQKEIGDVLADQVKKLEIYRSIDKAHGSELTKFRDAEILAQTEIIGLEKKKYELNKKRMLAVSGPESDLLDNSLKSMNQALAAAKDAFNFDKSRFDMEVAMLEKKYTEQKKHGELASTIGREQFGIQNKTYDNYKKINGQISKTYPELGSWSIPISAIITLLSHAYALFNDFDKAAYDFRIKMGMVRNEVRGQRDMAEKLAVSLMHVGVKIGDAYTAIQELGEEMGSIHIVTKELVQTTALLKAQLGVSEQVTSGFLRNMASAAGSTMKTQENMAYVAANMSKAAGISLPLVMKDISTKSATTLIMISKFPEKIIRTAIEARRLNTTLDTMARAGSEILNFSSNVADEMEASVLIGKSLNLETARQLMYANDLEGATKEILRISNEMDFNNLDKFQMEAFAKATGFGVAELKQMLQAEKEMKSARNSSDPEVRKLVASYDDMLKSSKAQVVSEAEKYKINLMTLSNQTRLTALSQKWEQVLAKATYWMLNIFDWALSIGEKLGDWTPWIMALSPALGLMLPIFSSIGKYLFAFGESALKFGGILGKVGSLSAGLGTAFSWIGKVGTVMGTFGKMIPILGWVIVAFQAIGGAIDGWKSGTGDIVDKISSIAMGIGRAIIPGFDYIVGALTWVYDKLVAIGRWGYSAMSWLWDGAKKVTMFLYEWTTPIGLAVKALSFLKENFTAILEIAKSWASAIWIGLKSVIGFSPSELGLAIVRGISSVGGMIFDALTSPFRNFLAWIADKIPGMSKVAGALRGGIGDMTTGSVERNAANASENTTITTPLKSSDQANTTTATQAATKESKETKYSLDDIYEMLKQLNDNLLSGKVKSGEIYLDGSQVSSYLARGIAFRGNFGTNT